MRTLAVCLLLVLAQDKKPPALKASRNHPRLFGTDAQLKQMALQKPKLWQSVIANVDVDSILPLKIRTLGFAYQVTGDKKKAQKAIELAKEVIRKGITTEHVEFETRLWPVAECYDLCFTLLTKQDRKEFIDYVNAMFDANKNPGVDSYVGPFHNTQLRRIMAFGLAGYATFPENPRAEEIVHHVKKVELGEILLPALKVFGDGGGWYEGRGYDVLCLFELLTFCDVAKRVENFDLMGGELKKYFEGKCLHEMFANYPGWWKDYRARRWAVQGDGHDSYAGFCELNRACRHMLINAMKDTPAGQYLNTYNADTPDCTIPGYLVLDFQYKNDGGGMLPLDTGPMSHIEEGIGTVYAVSGWDDYATWMRFQCGDHFTWHQHYEQNSFQIFKRGKLATNGGTYGDGTSAHSVNYYIRSVAQNTVLVYLPDEKWTEMRNGKSAESNDGGQAAKWAPRHTCPNLATFEKEYDKYHTGRILAYETKGAWTYVCGDATPAYSKDKMKKFVRHFLFMRPDLFVVFDLVVVAKPELKTTWVMNTVNAPKLEGAKGEVKEGDGKLLLECFLPEKATLKSVGDFTVDGKSYPAEKTGDYDRAGKFRIEMEAKDKGAHEFLFLITTGDLVPKAKVIREEGMVGLEMDNFKVLFKADGNPGGKIGRENLPTQVAKE
jgi:hypothetical protein